MIAEFRKRPIDKALNDIYFYDLPNLGLAFSCGEPESLDENYEELLQNELNDSKGG